MGAADMIRTISSIFAGALLLLGACSSPATAQTVIVASCGSLGALSWTAGQTGRPLTMDVNGVLCTSSTGGGGGGASSSFNAAFPATGTAAGLSDGTNMKSWLTASALADGVNGNNTGAVASWLYNGTTWDRARGDATNGAWVNVKASALPSGAATAANQALILAAVQGDVPSVTGPLAAATAVATKSLIVGGQYLATQPTMTNTQQAGSLLSARGAQLVAPGVENFPVQAAQSGTWVVGGNAAVSVVPTIQAAAYASGNAVGALQTVAVFRSTSQPSGIINNVLLAWKGTQTTAITFYVFDTNPSGSTCTDKTAFSLATADIPKLALQPFTLTAAAPAVGTTATSAASAFAPASVKNQDGSPTVNLYVCAVSGGAFTPAVGDMTYKISVAQD
jgi:hypothetical protein